MTLIIEAPTDTQLGYIADLCAKTGHEPPAVVASKQEASEIITALRTGSYIAERYDWPFEGGYSVKAGA